MVSCVSFRSTLNDFAPFYILCGAILPCCFLMSCSVYAVLFSILFYMHNNSAVLPLLCYDTNRKLLEYKHTYVVNFAG